MKELNWFGWIWLRIDFQSWNNQKTNKIKWKTIEIIIQLLVLYCIQVVWKVIFDFDLCFLLIDWCSFEFWSIFFQTTNQTKSNWWEMIEMIKTIKGNWDLRRRNDWEFIWFDCSNEQMFDFASNLFELRNQSTNQPIRLIRNINLGW